MVQRNKLAQKLAHLSGSLFKKHEHLAWLTPTCWKTITTHNIFLQRLEQLRLTQNLVSWHGNLDAIISVQNSTQPYTVLAVDGSQIYPDRHLQGFDCFVINVGGCLISYGPSSAVQFFSEPFVYVPEQFENLFDGLSFSVDCVDLLREEHELKFMVQKGETVTSMNHIALFDGNLLFWHLENKPIQVKELFMDRYCAQLYLLYQKRILHAGYLSASRFRDLCKLFEIGLRNSTDYKSIEQQLEFMDDIDLLKYVLAPGQRTTVFHCTMPIVALYPTQTQPCFFYMHGGSEIVRIEIPLWIATNDVLVDAVAMLCYDQTKKGNGYPVVLAESHMQAVVQNSDRDFFYHMIQKHAIVQQQCVSYSQKSIKKRAMNV